EGTVGGHWGLLDGESRTRKFDWGVPLSNHPYWPWQATLGILLAAAVISSAGRAGRLATAPPTVLQWSGILALALVPGVPVGWAAANVPTESLGAAGWIHSLAMFAVAAVAPIAAAAALVRNLPIPTFSDVLAHAKGSRFGSVELVLGVCWILLGVLATEVALGLAFDPRYRDFPFAPLGAAATPFLIVMLLGARGGRRELAETIMAAVLSASTLYIAWNEGPANWQALYLCGVFAGVVFTLLRPLAAPSSE